MTKEWQPRIVAFFCNWCTYTAADLAGVSRLKHASNVRVIRLMCSGRVDPHRLLPVLDRLVITTERIVNDTQSEIIIRRGRGAGVLP